MTSDYGGALWVEGNFNGGKAEQKGVEFNGTWYATERLNFEWSAFLASPEFTEDTFVTRTRTTIYIAEGTTMPISPKEKYWAAVEYTFPDFLPLQGDLLDPVFVHLAEQGLGQPRRRSRTSRSAETPEEKDEALEFLIPEWKSGTFQIGFTSDNGWDAAFIVRNVFDDAGYTYLSSTWYGEDFGDPRWRHIRNLQRAAELQPVVHQEMVTRPA